MSFNSQVVRLTTAQALSGANSAIVYATGAIIGHDLAPSPSLATLPISIFVVGMALSTLPVGTITRRHGRRAAFLVGNLCGILLGLIAAAALAINSFALFCIAMLFGGAYAAVVLTFRFAAAECVTPQEQPRALSAVLLGGVAAGVFGPQLVTATMNLWPSHSYLPTYLGASVAALLSAVVLVGGEFSRPTAPSSRHSQVVAWSSLLQPRFIVAMLCGTVSYMMMNFMMTSAPLAMELHGIARVHSNYGIEMHIVAMYAPSFFTGRLISRFGQPKVIVLGLLLIGFAAITGMHGMSVGHFWTALVLLGVGWNFSFLGASSMVLTCHASEEGPRAQAINDFVVFGSMVVGSFASGSLLNHFGWSVVSSFILVPVALAIGALAWLYVFRGRSRAIS
ncbi:MFS transporter [Pseudomonas aeruginosa]|nr:MFS transporter [Pseudomonas aeruginosa]MCS8829173.1 MFS transporter [Pseudomonas aeruginosa]MCS8874006.1 MFS transporter [Pseudomonas aeruginosa]MCS8907996.1 MFS transporter [Pseudomonas aeruginosa]MCS8914047.1 MFS transporter [Pseudomonas aeruginosa]